MARNTKLTSLDFGAAQLAVESFGKTVDALAGRHSWEIADAILEHAPPTLTHGELSALEASTKKLIYDSGGKLADGDRFGSYEELSQWVISAAEERGWTTREEQQPTGTKLFVQAPAGEIYFTLTEKGDKADIGYGATADDESAAMRVARELLSAASALQADA